MLNLTDAKIKAAAMSLIEEDSPDSQRDLAMLQAMLRPKVDGPQKTRSATYVIPIKKK